MVLTRRKKSFSSTGSNNVIRSPRKTIEEAKEKTHISLRSSDKRRTRSDSKSEASSPAFSNKGTPERRLEKSFAPTKDSFKAQSKKAKTFKKATKPSLRLNEVTLNTDESPTVLSGESSSRLPDNIELNFDSIPKNSTSKPDLPRKWTASSEIVLFRCMSVNKPAGIHKHFHMANICHNFNKNNAHPRTVKELWGHLETLFDLQAIDEMEFLPPDEWSVFPERRLDLQTTKEFVLPDSQFKALKTLKAKLS